VNLYIFEEVGTEDLDKEAGRSAQALDDEALSILKGVYA
jgi:hypothetical protein